MKKNYRVYVFNGENGIEIENVLAVTISEVALMLYTEVGEGVLPHAVVPLQNLLYLESFD